MVFKNTTITSTSAPRNTSNTDNSEKPKRVVKHSKKFVRTQTGCLQCRQKKKKCDGKRPVCVSCEKRGICCEFPANIRFFQFNNTPSTETSKTVKNELVFNSVTMKKSGSEPIKMYPKNEIISTSRWPKYPIKQDNKRSFSTSDVSKSYQFKNEGLNYGSPFKKLKRSLSTSSTIFESQQESTSEPQSRSLSLSSNAPSLISDLSDSESIPSNRSSTPNILASELLNIIAEPVNIEEIKQDVKKSVFHKDHTESALHLANEGESISTILNNITIDLIKRSIHNLKYIDFESKLNDFYINQPNKEPTFNDQVQITEQIKEGLEFVEKNSTVNFKPDEFLRFND